MATAMRSAEEMTDRMQNIIRQKIKKKTYFFAEYLLFGRGVHLLAATNISSTCSQFTKCSRKALR